MDFFSIPLLATLIGTTIFSAISSRRAQKRQNAYNDAAADKAYEQQQSLIDAQNQYNSPANQMSLLSDAGLNPLLAYNGLASSAQQTAGEPQVASHDYIKSTEDTIAAVNMLSQVLMQSEKLRSLKLKNDLQEYKLDYENPLKLQLLEGNIDWLSDKVGLTKEQLSRLQDTHDYFVNTWAENSSYAGSRAGNEEIKHRNAIFDWDMNGAQLRNDILRNQWETLDYTFKLKKQFDADEREANLARKALMAKFYNGTATWKDTLHFLTGELLSNVAPTLFGMPLKFNMPTFNNNSSHQSLFQSTQNNNSTQTHQHVHQHTGSVSNVTHYEGDNRSTTTFKHNKWKRK